MPTLINSTINSVTNSSSNASVSITIPSGGQVGDLLVINIASNDALNPSSLSGTGWNIATQNYSTTNGGTSPHLGLLWRWWDGSDPVTINIGADIRDDQWIVNLWRGVDATTPIGAISASYVASSSTSYTAQSVNTTLPNSTLVSFCAAKNGASALADDTGQPTGMNCIFNRRSRANSSAVRSAVAYETIASAGATGTRQWASFLSTASYLAAFNYVLNPSASASISSVNSGAGITAGSTGNTAQLSGYSSAPTSALHGPLSMTNLSYNGGTQVLTFDCPAYADGATWPPFDATATFTVANGSQSADLNSTPTNPPTGWTTVTIVSPNTTDSTYIGYYTDLSNHEIVYETKIGQSVIYPAEGLVIATDSGVSLPADLAGDHVMYKRNLTSNVITRLTVTINDANEVTGIVDSGVSLGIGIGISI